MKDNKDKAREALDRLYRQGCAACEPHNPEGFCAEDDFDTIRKALQPKAVDVEALKKDIDQLGVIKHYLEQRRCTQDHIDTLGEIYERFNSAFN